MNDAIDEPEDAPRNAKHGFGNLFSIKTISKAIPRCQLRPTTEGQERMQPSARGCPQEVSSIDLVDLVDQDGLQREFLRFKVSNHVEKRM